MAVQNISGDPISNGSYLVNEAAFSQPVINIGSDPGNDLELAGSLVADFHCMLLLHDNGWRLLPLDTRNIVMLNGRQVPESGAPINAEDLIGIGDYQLRPAISGMNLDILIYQKQSSNTGAVRLIDASDGDKLILLSLQNAPTEVMPGDEAEFVLDIANGGSLVANMQLQLQGIPPAWVTIVPPLINLNEAQRGTFTVRISPPREASSLAGVYKAHFVASSPNYPHQTGIVDAELSVLPYYEFLVGSLNPRSQTVSRLKRSAKTELPIINLSNTDVSFNVHTTDGENKVNFSYPLSNEMELSAQAAIPVKAGDTYTLPISVSPHSLPLISLIPRTHHYSTSVSIPSQPMAAQITPGEVKAKPILNWILLLLAMLAIAVGALLICQPRIYSFHTDVQGDVIENGAMTELTWRVSSFTETLTLTHDNESVAVNKNKGYQIAPKSSAVYTLTAENWVSRLLRLNRQRTLNILVIPETPNIMVFEADKNYVQAGETVNTRWSVEDNADKAVVIVNKQSQTLPVEQFTGQLSAPVMVDTLSLMRASNASGTVSKSFFINASPAKVRLKTYAIWVKPFEGSFAGDGVAASSVTWTNTTHGDSTTTSISTQDGSTNTNTTHITTDLSTTSAVYDASHVRALPVAMDNVLVIPDDLSGSSVVHGSNSNVGSANSSEPLPETIIRTNPYGTPEIQSTAPKDSPEMRAITSEFTVKLCEIIPDALNPTGYRVINYYPGYELPEETQVMVEWAVDGVKSVTIDPLSGEALSPSGANFYFPKESMNFTLNAEAGEDKESFLLPVNVIGPNDPSKKETRCTLKANPGSLTTGGKVVLAWQVVGPFSRITLASSAQAEKEVQAAKEKMKKAAEAEGKEYVEPQNVASGGGLIADYIQSSGFMTVNVNTKTTFTVEAFNGTSSAVCSAPAEINVTDGDDKLNIKLAINKTTNTQGNSQENYLVSQPLLVTTALTDWDKAKVPTGTISVTDGLASCAITYPATTCALRFSNAGAKTLTATYSGDSNYKKAYATAAVKVIEKIPTEIIIINVDPRQNVYYAFQTPKFTVNLDYEPIISAVPGGKVILQGFDEQWQAVSASKCSYTLPADSCSLPLTSAVKYVLANYEGDDNYAGSYSDVFEIEVSKYPVIMTITQPSRNSYYSVKDGQWYPINKNEKEPWVVCPQTTTAPSAVCEKLTNKTTVSVSFNYPDTMKLPDGTVVKITDASGGNCSITLPSLSCDLTFTSAGNKTIYAEVAEMPAFEVEPTSLSTLHVVDAEGTVRTDTTIVALAPTLQRYVKNSSVDVVVSVEDRDDAARIPTGTVTIYDELQNDSCEVNYPAENRCTLRLLTSGHPVKLYAAYSGNSTGSVNWAPSVSDPESINVDAYGNLPAFLNITKPESGQSFKQFSSTSVGISLFDKDGIDISKFAEGIVTVSDGNGNFCLIELPNKGSSDAECTLNLKSAGVLSLTASYEGDEVYKKTRSDSIPVTVETRDSSTCKTSIIINKLTDSNGTPWPISESSLYETKVNNKVRFYYTVSPEGDCSVCQNINCRLDGKVKISLIPERGTDILTCEKTYIAGAAENYCTITSSLPNNNTYMRFSIRADYFGDTHYADSYSSRMKNDFYVQTGTGSDMGKYDDEVHIKGIRYSKGSDENLAGKEVIAGTSVFIDFEVLKVSNSPVTSVSAFGDNTSSTLMTPAPTVGKIYTVGPIKFTTLGWRKVLGLVVYSNRYWTQSDFQINVVAANSLSIKPAWRKLNYSGSGGSCTSVEGDRISDDEIRTTSNGLQVGDGLSTTLTFEPKSGSAMEAKYSAGDIIGTVFAEECFPSGYCLKSDIQNVKAISNGNSLVGSAALEIPLLPQKGKTSLTFYFSSVDGYYDNSQLAYIIPVSIAGDIYLYPAGTQSSDIQSTNRYYEWELLTVDGSPTEHYFDAYLALRGNSACKTRLSSTTNSAGQAFYASPDIRETEMSYDGTVCTGGVWNSTLSGYQFACTMQITGDKKVEYIMSGGADYQTIGHYMQVKINQQIDEPGLYITSVSPTSGEMGHDPVTNVGIKLVLDGACKASTGTGYPVKVIASRDGKIAGEADLTNSASLFTSCTSNAGRAVYTGMTIQIVNYIRAGSYRISAEYSDDPEVMALTTEVKDPVTIKGYEVELSDYVKVQVDTYDDAGGACQINPKHYVNNYQSTNYAYDIKAGDVVAGSKAYLTFRIPNTNTAGTNGVMTATMCYGSTDPAYPMCSYLESERIAEAVGFQNYEFTIDPLPAGGDYKLTLDYDDLNGRVQSFSQDVILKGVDYPYIAIAAPYGWEQTPGVPSTLIWRDSFPLIEKQFLRVYILRGNRYDCREAMSMTTYPVQFSPVPNYVFETDHNGNVDTNCEWGSLWDSHVLTCSINNPDIDDPIRSFIADTTLYYGFVSKSEVRGDANYQFYGYTETTIQYARTFLKMRQYSPLGSGSSVTLNVSIGQ